jgi:Mor family transcriptional regulator
MNRNSLVDELPGLRLIGRATKPHDGHVQISFMSASNGRIILHPLPRTMRAISRNSQIFSP